MKRPPLLRLIALLLVIFALQTGTQADPKDWGDNDWFKHIEAIAWGTVGDAAGAVGGVVPAADIYGALSAAGSAVKPGLRAWLHRKMREAVEADDFNRLNVYQAYTSALDGNPGPLQALQRKPRPPKESEEAPAVALNSVVASSDSSGRVSITVQYTVSDNTQGKLKNLTAGAMLTGPGPTQGTSHSVSLSRNEGYQAAEFFLNLSDTYPSGRYRVNVNLSSPKANRTTTKSASFQLKRPSKPTEPKEPEVPETPPEPDEPEEPTKPPVGDEPTTPDKPKPPTGGTPTKPEPSTRPLQVQIVAPSRTSTRDTAQLVAQVDGGTPPYNYQWSTNGKLWTVPSFNLSYDRPGVSPIRLKVIDSLGAEVEATSSIKVEEGFKIRISGPRKVAKGTTAAYKAVVVNGPTSGVRYSWTSGAQSGTGPNFNTQFQTSGKHKVICEARQPEHPPYKFTATVTVPASTLKATITGPATIKAGSKIFYAGGAEGGVPPYSYSWLVEGRTSVKQGIKGRFDKPGQELVVLQVTDSKGAVAKTSLSVKVLGADKLTATIVGPNETTAGERVALSAKVEGGIPPYSYAWQVKGKTVNKREIKGEFDKPGNELVVMEVTDSEKTKTQSSLNIRVLESKTLSAKIAGPKQAKLGQKVRFTPQVRGGVPPYRYVWTVKGKTIEKKSIGGEFDSKGEKTVSLKVYDSGEWQTKPVVASHTLSVEESAGRITASQLFGKSYSVKLRYWHANAWREVRFGGTFTNERVDWYGGGTGYKFRRDTGGKFATNDYRFLSNGDMLLIYGDYLRGRIEGNISEFKLVGHFETKRGRKQAEMTFVRRK